MKARIADFPDWFGPMLVKELRQSLNTRGFVYSFIGLQTVLTFVMVIAVLVYARDAQAFDANVLGGIFWILIGAMLIFVTPLRAFNSLAAERKANTLELIFMSGLSAWRIVFGKWVSLLFQALLFLLAVLPFAILRYFFGGVNLVEDLQSLLAMVLSCAVASAVALAISGMPLWVRVMVGVGLVLSFTKSDGLDFFDELWEYVRSGDPVSFHTTAEMSWWLTGFNSLLACLLALEIAAATVAPPAENHAGRQRFLALLFWLPLPFLNQMAVSEDTLHRQLWLFMSCSGVLIWQHLSVRPVLFASHCRPFRGWRSTYGLPFQIGWPSAVVFLLLGVVLLVLAMPALGSLDPLSVELVPYFVMAAAALLSAVVFWKA
ncbi:MAG TPA: hypothetical protein VGO11_27315, partial [Chthoniobacteraceae bacterium]|nr:hypothetical protein [Chthoniobacteraceae bacterium]